MKARTAAVSGNDASLARDTAHHHALAAARAA